jgi:sugar (pentulose or hexulose) kinase
MGAGSIRIVQGFFGQEITMKEIYRFENKIEWMDGADRWNLQTITQGILFGIEKALKETTVPIKSIGVDSWGVDYVVIDNNGLPLENPISYRDKRTQGMKELWNSLMDEKETFQRTGVNYNVFNTLYQLLSAKDSELIGKTNRILLMAEYINFFLSGTTKNEITLSSTSQMLNCFEKQWDTKIIDLLHLKHAQLETPILPGTNLGHLKSNLFPNTAIDVIAVAGHDTACAVAAIPAENNDFAFISTGTWCVFGTISETPFTSAEAFKLGITNEMTADGKFRPLKNLMGLWLIQQLRIAFGSVHSFAQIDEMADNAEPSIYLIDPSDVLFYNPDNMKTAFDHYLMTKFSIELHSHEEYYRCAYESLVASFKTTFTQFERLRGKKFTVVHTIGGGSQSKLLCQLTANTLNCKVIAGPVEGAVLGNLMIQYKAINVSNSATNIQHTLAQSLDVKTYNPL